MAAQAVGHFVLVSEQGFGKYVFDRFATEGEALAKGNKFWCCWVLFREASEGGVISELAHGGVGFAHPGIRRKATETIRGAARDREAREAARAAAEARFGAAASAKPKEKPRAAIPSDGRPDLSNARAWD